MTAIVLAALLVTLGAGNGAAQDKEAKRWRIIVNDDGEATAPAEGGDLEAYLSQRFADVVGTQVDAYFLCVASTDRGPETAPKPPHVQDTMSHWFPEMKAPAGIDELIRAYIKAAHDNGIELFAAMRLNDIHDAWVPKLSYPLKVAHPEWLLAKRESRPKDALMAAHWSGFDWSRDEVRQHFLDFILSFCSQYDVDGVELDYFRHALFFKLGEEEASMDKMTDFVRKVREGLTKIGDERGRPCRVAIRLPDSPELARRTGFDLEQWLKEGLLDMLMAGGGYMPYSSRRYKESIDLAHLYDVQAYPCINHFQDPIKMRSCAGNSFALGGDGFYIFNYGGVEDGSEQAACLRQCGSPETLTGLDKLFAPDGGCKIYYCGQTNPPSPFPADLVGGSAIELVVGDDVAEADAAGRIEALVLRIKVTNVRKEAKIAVQINGIQTSGKALERSDDETFLVTGQADLYERGINRITILPGADCLGRLSSKVVELDLSVKYKPGPTK